MSTKKLYLKSILFLVFSFLLAIYTIDAAHSAFHRCDKDFFSQYLLNHQSSSIYTDYYLKKRSPLLSNDSLGQALLNACENNNLLVAKKLVSMGADVNYQEKRHGFEFFFKWFGHYVSPIVFAIKNNNPDMCLFLIDEGVSVMTAIRLSLGRNNDEISWTLLNSNKRIDLSEVLFYAIEYNNNDIFKYCISKNANINALSSSKRTILEEAVFANNISACKYIVEKLNFDPLWKNENGRNLLMIAANQNSIPLIDYFLTRGIDINSVDNSGHTPLYYTLYPMGAKEAFYYLIKKGTNIHHIDNNKNSLSNYALANFNTEDEFYFLVKNGVGIDHINKNNISLLIQAIKEKHSNELIAFLIDSGVDINHIDNKNKTALMYVIHSGLKDKEIIKKLIKKGANIETKTPEGETLLFMATKNTDYEMIDFLLTQGANIEARNPRGETCTFKAIESGNYNILKLLIDNGANINTTNLVGEKPKIESSQIARLLLDNGLNTETKYAREESLLFSAIESGNYEMINLLLEKGADINSKNNENAGPVIQNQEMAVFLLKNGFDINTQDSFQNSLLCKAVEWGNLTLLNYLVKNGANSEILCINNETALVKATINQDTASAKYLLENGANYNSGNKKGEFVIDIALSNGNNELVRYLKDLGALPYPERFICKTLKEETISTHKLWELRKNLRKTPPSFFSDTKKIRLAEIAAQNGDKSIIDFLLKELKFNINTPVNNNNQTMLIIAVINGRKESVKYLLEKGADICYIDGFNKNILNYTNDKGFQKFLKQKAKSLGKKLKPVKK